MPQRNPERTPLFLLAALACWLTAACQPLIHEPWSRFPEDATAAGVMAGWNFSDVDITMAGREFEGGPIEGEEVNSSFETSTVFDVGIVGDYYLTENWVVDGRIEWRSNEPDPFTLGFQDVSYDFSGEEYVTNHFALGMRYVFDPLGKQRRFRSFLGAELSYVPEFKTQFQARSGLGQAETLTVEADGLYVLGAKGGFSILLDDDTVFDLGVLWELPLGTQTDSQDFGDGGVGANSSRVDLTLEPDTIVLYATLKASI